MAGAQVRGRGLGRGCRTLLLLMLLSALVRWSPDLPPTLALRLCEAMIDNKAAGPPRLGKLKGQRTSELFLIVKGSGRGCWNVVGWFCIMDSARIGCIQWMTEALSMRKLSVQAACC